MLHPSQAKDKWCPYRGKITLFQRFKYLILSMLFGKKYSQTVYIKEHGCIGEQCMFWKISDDMISGYCGVLDYSNVPVKHEHIPNKKENGIEKVAHKLMMPYSTTFSFSKEALTNSDIKKHINKHKTQFKVLYKIIRGKFNE